jgi:hypothetical protein
MPKERIVPERLLMPDLYKYLVSLTAALERVGEADAAQQTLHVSKFASGSTSELYGEARLLLPKILQNNGALLLETDRARLREIIAGLESEFRRIRGS